MRGVVGTIDLGNLDARNLSMRTKEFIRVACHTHTHIHMHMGDAAIRKSLFLNR